MLCIDNSEFSRNGDYNPSRLDAQTDCANVVAGAKSQQHPENVVGVAFMSNAEIKLTPCQDIGKVLAVLSEVSIAGESDLIRAIQTSAIALKHRQNKNQKQRIICFVASPVTASEKQLEQLGKILKKNNVSVDVVSIGDVDGSNKMKLEKFVEAAGALSHFVNVEPGKILSDVIVSSPILLGENAAEKGMVGGGDEFGFDPNMDPELAMAIRLSMEEERQRQAAAVAGGTSAASTAGASSERAPLSVAPPGSGADEFDAELRAALLASMQESGNGDTAPSGAVGAAQDVEMDEELRKALAESMEDWDGGKEEEQDDPALVAELLATLPGADVNDPRIQAALKAVRDQKRQQK